MTLSARVLEEIFGAGAARSAAPSTRSPIRPACSSPSAREDGSIEELIVLFGNRAAEGLLGIDLKSAPLRLTEIAPTVREEGVFDLFCGVIETGEPWLGDRQFGGTAGANRLEGTFQIRAVRMGDGVLFLVRDVSAQRAFEAEVERVTAIVENTDDAILSADPEGMITHWNPRRRASVRSVGGGGPRHAARAARAAPRNVGLRRSAFARAARRPPDRADRVALGAQGPHARRRRHHGLADGRARRHGDRRLRGRARHHRTAPRRGRARALERRAAPLRRRRGT